MEKKVDVCYLNDEVMFLLADSFSLGTVLYEINEALSITGYNQVYKSLYNAISQSQMRTLIPVLILIHTFSCLDGVSCMKMETKPQTNITP